MTDAFALEAVPLGQFRIFGQDSGYAKAKPQKEVERFGFGKFFIEWSQPLSASFLKGDDGDLMGIVLGHAFVIDSGERLSSKHVAGFNRSTYQNSDFERLYESLFGAFIIIISIEGKFYLHPDAGATLSVVYSRELGIVGATASAILSSADYRGRFLADLYDRLDVKNEGWFPAGLTAHRGVDRLYCSHRLDLETLTASRCWPTVAPRRSEDPDAALDQLGSVVRDSLRLVYDNFRAAQALTGGSDSRTLLSLTGGFRDRVSTYTIDSGLPHMARDIFLASKVARTLGVPYRVLTTVDDPEVCDRWRFRCGDAVGGINAVVHTGLNALAGDGVEAVVDGIGAETARCLLWRDSDAADKIPSAYALTQRLGLHSADEVTKAVQCWLDGCPRGDAFFILDMAELELRFSAWAYTQSYVDPPLLHFSPFVSRRSLNAMLALPVETMRKGFGKEIVRRAEPALAEIPYNKWGDHRDWLSPIMRSLKEPHLVTKKLRKIMAA